MTTEKTEGADNSATEGAAEVTLDTLRAELTSNADKGDEATETAEAKAERVRDEAGRFAKAEAKAEEEKDEWLQPPSALKPEYKAEWAKLPKNWRSEFYRRESDFHKGIDPYKQSHQAWEKWQKEILAPHSQRIQAAGIPPEQYVREFLTLDHVLATGTPQQKRQAVEAFTKFYGLNLSEYVQTGQQQTQQQQRDPTVAALEEKLARLEGTLTQSQTAAQEREQQEALTQITAFKSDPKNIYFDDVREHMAALLNSGKAKDMSDAYEQACWANPNVRNALLQQRAKDEEQKRIEEAKRKTADARRAGFDVQAQGAAQSGSKPLSLREELAQRAGVQLS